MLDLNTVQNDLYKLVALKQEMKTLNTMITEACEKFVYLHGKVGDKFVSWDFNERNTLLFIHYNSEKEDNLEFVCSFDEIQKLIDENKPNYKSVKL